VAILLYYDGCIDGSMDAWIKIPKGKMDGLID
jgi:hypothetical protein